MGYKELVFDLYGTLVDIHTEESAQVWEKTALFFGLYGAKLTGKQLKRAYCAALAAMEKAEGKSRTRCPEIPMEQVLEQVLEAAGAKDAARVAFQGAQLFRVNAIEYIRLYPGVREALAALRQRGCRLWLLSNAQRAFTAYELRLLGLEEAFDGVFLSSDHRCRKPDTRFFRALLEEHGLEAANCLMIGNDRRTDIAGAKAAGMASLYLHTNLTPADQAPADPGLLPGKAPGPHFEYAGSNWARLTKLLEKLL